MKLQPHSFPSRARQSGFFLVMTLFIIAGIMLIYVAANHRQLHVLRKEIDHLEHQQNQHWQTAPVPDASTP